MQKERSERAANEAPANTVVALESRLVKEVKARVALEEQLDKEKRARFVLESMLASNIGGTTTTASSSARSTGFRETETDSDSEVSASGSGSGPVGRPMPHATDMHTITEYEYEEQERAAPQQDVAVVEEAAKETAEIMARIENEESGRKPEEDEAAVDDAAEQMARTAAEERARQPEDDAAINEVAESNPQNETASKQEDDGNAPEARASTVKKQSNGKKSVTIVGDSDAGQQETSQESSAKVQ